MNSMCCLILHGLAGSPFEVRPMAEALEAAGHVAVCPVLPGHAASEEEYLTSSYSQWLDCARAAYLDQCSGGPALLAGYSLGGLLALDRQGLRRAEPLPPGRGTKPCVRTATCSNWRWRKKGCGRLLAGYLCRCAPCSYIVMAYARLSIPVFCLNSAARLM